MKNFLHLTLRDEDFGVPAKWHFINTSHGKFMICPRRNHREVATWTNLQQPLTVEITTPRQLFRCTEINI
jgi:hypothetical protein